MRATVGLVAVVGVLLAGCDTKSEPTGDKVSSPLAAIDLCGMVDHATIEGQFNEPVVDAQGGREEHIERETVSCIYVMKSLMTADMENLNEALDVSTRLQAATDQARTAEEALDAYLVDQNDEVVNYERVDGLGEVAGYADSALGVALGENHLVAILEVDGGFVAVVTKSSPEGTVEQLRPIAEELVKGVETKLR